MAAGNRSRIFVAICIVGCTVLLGVSDWYQPKCVFIFCTRARGADYLALVFAPPMNRLWATGL